MSILNSAKKAAAMFGIAFALVFTQMVHAENAITLAATINNYSSGSGSLLAVADGNTVTVTGEKTGVSSGLVLAIDEGVTVVWKASLSGVGTLLSKGGGAGTLEISGGTVKANTGVAVYAFVGLITVSGTATITSEYAGSSTSGTIHLTSSAELNITGGTVENTYSGTTNPGNAKAIYSTSTGTVNISGGMVKAITGYAVYNTNGPINLTTNGVVFAYGETDTDVIYGSYNAEGNGVVIAWNNAKDTYTAFENDDIYKSSGTAKWLNRGGMAGIDYANGTNTGFIPLTVNVIKKTITITGVAATDRDYDGTLTVELTGGTLQGVESGDDVSFTLSSGTMENADVGSDKSVTTNIVLTGTAAGNYTLTQPSNVTVNINKETPILTNRENPIIRSIGVKITANTITLSNLPPNTKVELYNLKGKQIYSAYPENPKILKIGVQTKGVYVVKVGNQRGLLYF